MSKKIKFESWNGRMIELDRDKYIERVLNAASPGLDVLVWDNYEEIEAMKARIAEMAGEKFDRIAEKEEAA